MTRARLYTKIALLTCTVFFCKAHILAENVDQCDVFTSGTEDYNTFRIPAIVSTTSGTLLAFAEGRHLGRSDTGDIDTVLRRSYDNGKTWQPLQIVWDDKANTCGNPSPVVDRETGRIVLLSTWNRGDDYEKDIDAGSSRDTRRVFVSYSSDDGVSWTDPKEITASVKKANWRWYATGPGHGIQLDDGRLVIPCNHTVGAVVSENKSHSHVITSTDGGETWELGGSTGPSTNESTVVSLDDGRLLLNSRSNHKLNRRAVSWSSDKGKTWYGPFLDSALIEPVCQGSLLKVKQEGKSHYIFSNPASKKREKMTVKVSRDECETWSKGLVLNKGFSAYSDLVELPGDEIGCLYESDWRGQTYGRIRFAHFPFSELENLESLQ